MRPEWMEEAVAGMRKLAKSVQRNIDHKNKVIVAGAFSPWLTELYREKGYKVAFVSLELNEEEHEKRVMRSLR